MSCVRWLLALAFVLVPSLAHAHAQSPTSLQLFEQQEGSWTVTLRRPANDALRVAVPEGCRSSASSSRREGLEQVEEQQWHCHGPLVGRAVDLVGLEIGALVVVMPRTGPSVSSVVSPTDPVLVVAAAPGDVHVLGRYAQLGAEHLAAGLDHLLLVLALVVLATRVRPLVATLTAFTVGHSITLALVALGVVAPPSTWAELAIAATLLVLASQLYAPPRTSVMHGPLVACCFGLVHGLGFAGALAEIGLPEHARIVALVGFDIGLELAQLALVLLAWPAWQATRGRHGHRIRRALGWITGALACMWIFERGF
jgi:hydrogenase/urease accessory protein HupE